MTLRNNSSRNRLLITYWQWCSWFSHVQLQCKYSPRSWSPWGAHKSPLPCKWIQCICQSRSLQLWGGEKKIKRKSTSCNHTSNMYSQQKHIPCLLTQILLFSWGKMSISLLFLHRMKQQRESWVKFAPSRSPWCWTTSITSSSLPQGTKSCTRQTRLKASITAVWSQQQRRQEGANNPWKLSPLSC